MRANTSIGRRLALLCVFGLFPIATLATPVLQIKEPSSGAQLETGVDHKIRVRWTNDGEPVVFSEINVDASFGTLSDSVIETKLDGYAEVMISSATAGASVFVAKADALEDQIDIEFVAPADLPFGGLAITKNPGDGNILYVLPDRIGFLGQPGVTLEDVAARVGDLGVERVLPLSTDVFVLEFDAPLSMEEFRSTAAELSDDYDDIVRKPGWVAQIKDSDQWLVLPNEILIRFKEGLTETEINEVLSRYDPNNILESPGNELRMLIKLGLGTGGKDVFTELMELKAFAAILLYATPNYVIPIEPRSPADEPGFEWQWTLESNDQLGLSDADVDASGAWGYTTGSSDTIVAVVDRGFYIFHPDFFDNLWQLTESTKKGIDLIDADSSDLSSSVTDYEPYAHGTSVAGIVGAIGDNKAGVTGICPDCQLLLIRTESDLNVIVAAIELAVQNGADVITNSWGFDGTYPAFNMAIDDANAKGAIVFFAMSNRETDDCADNDISSYVNVVGVSGVTDFDRRAPLDGQAKGYGPCMDIVAPTAGGDQGVMTTSVEYDSGPVATYRNDFSGTSAAAPLAAGIAALVSGLDKQLQPIQIQRILQDTADRVAHYDFTRPGESANYDPESGFSDPGGTPRYGYGRVNALEAVRLVAPRNIESDRFGPGRSGRDLLLRDHLLDWGNTEQPSNTVFEEPRWTIDYYKSVDVKLDVEPFGTNPTDAQTFAALNPEEPEIGKAMRVHVRLRNRGPYAIESVDLKLLKAIVADGYPELPSDFWATFPGSHTATSDWKPAGDVKLADVAYSGASLAGCPGRVVPPCLPSTISHNDAAVIATFNVGAMDWDPSIHKGPAFFVVASSPEDLAAGLGDPANAKLDVLEHVNTDNNVTLWTAGPTPNWPTPPLPPDTCSDSLKSLILTLFALAAFALLVIVVLLATSRPVPAWLWSLLALVLIVLLYLYLTNPDCVSEALHHWFH